MIAYSKNRQGFTLLETVVIIVVIGILVTAALPKVISLRREALQAVSVSVIGSVNTGIAYYYILSEPNHYPDKLDQAGSGDSPGETPYFDVVIEYGIRDSRWSKTGDIFSYRAPNDTLYVYDPAAGIIK
ncbi:prepilin-type N-terminal cleavage/methylation domain-containing protein [candidate division KSB1 bacterium]